MEPSTQQVDSPEYFHPVMYTTATRLLELFTLVNKPDISIADITGEHPKYKIGSAHSVLKQMRKWGGVRPSETPGMYAIDMDKIRERVALCLAMYKRYTESGSTVKRARAVKAQVVKPAAPGNPVEVYTRAHVFNDAIAALKAKASQAVFAGALDMISSIESREDREKFAAEVKKLTDR